ncbi:MAG TPA: AAA family ATPase [Verrucomicrobiae bacterium]|jgi:putative ATP-dependent endonuclease of OLD family|nr:AAA family ATPase [Verrucomicrobiae bacterium]
MRISRIKIENFRGIKSGELLFPKYAALVGDNNSGKSTVLEAIDLCLGPERLSKHPVIDEHDFYAGRYLDKEENSVEIKVEIIVTDLSDEQKRFFRNHIEWWNDAEKSLLAGPPPEGTDAANVLAALRVGFRGLYNAEEDDFEGSTYFLSPVRDDGELDAFRVFDKRMCGFLFLRTLRTGSRALSLERGSLLDIILRLQEKRLQMWEEVLDQLRKLPVAEKKELGITDLLGSIQEAVRAFVPADWAKNPHMRVSDLTRESLRRVLTVFMATGAKLENGSEYAAPFQHQGTGTVNTLVLAMLSLIAELKQNVIFAMEEPEIAIPPHAQKRIVESVCKKSAQAFFTSHSPYVLGEFKPSQILVLKREDGILTGINAEYPPAVKPKNYRMEFRGRFCEALLARRVLILEGRTEYDAFPAAARRLNELHPDEFKTFEAMGIATVNAQTDSQVAPLGDYFKKIGKTVFAVFDKQEAAQKVAIEAAIPDSFESPEKGFEKLILNQTAEAALRRYALALVSDGEWPAHLAAKTPTAAMATNDLRNALNEYLSWSKGEGTAADLLGQCTKDEMPAFLVETLKQIKELVEPAPIPPVPPVPAAPTATAPGAPPAVEIPSTAATPAAS